MIITKGSTIDGMQNKIGLLASIKEQKKVLDTDPIIYQHFMSLSHNDVYGNWSIVSTTNLGESFGNVSENLFVNLFVSFIKNENSHYKSTA